MTESSNPYRTLDRKRRGLALSEGEIRDVVTGAVDGSWSDAQLAAFLMGCATRGMDGDETSALTRAMLGSGAQWDLKRDYPLVGDKHSTGGVGDKVSLVLSPVLAACGQPVVMLTGRGLGHTGGTADKLETIPGINLALDRERCCRLLDSCGMAIGMATDEIAPADRTLYALRDQTGTVVSIPLITASILSKKLATGAAAIVFDVKTGDGAFLSDPAESAALARELVATATSLGAKASALITDMSQPLGRWSGHSAEIDETMRCLEGKGPADLMEVVYRLAEEVASLAGTPLSRADLEAAVGSGRARELFLLAIEAHGGDTRMLERSVELAPKSITVEAPGPGFLSYVHTRQLGLLLAEAGGGRIRAGDEIDPAIALETKARIGEAVVEGQELARLWVRACDERIRRELEECFVVTDDPVDAPTLIGSRFAPDA